MKKLLYAAFCLTVAISLGCIALTYPTITDNDGSGVAVVNTNGKAHLIESSQTSQTLPGGRFEHVSFVDQGPGANQKLTSYELELGAVPNFHSDTYCNPDWTGCAWVTNDYDPATVPCSFSVARLNLNCLEISAVGVCFGYRPGECGRSMKSPAGLSASDLRTFLESGVELSPHLLEYTISPVNTSIDLTDPVGNTKSFNFSGSYQATLNLNRGMVNVDLSSIVHEQNLLMLANIADTSFANGTAHISFNGIPRDVEYGLLPGDHYRTVARRNF